GPESAFLRL
uniref:Extended FMRFamide-3 n=3 Tax=Mantophasmatodea TaxID=192413 RepID=FAR3_MANKU|nr:RecName: Full=Extended FMRFamide-3; Short=FMRFa-3 [Striatophasma naukluftense]B0M3C8.1 RecName: Full=Extended FMRFamide-3; Short=FMRFa-3 [Mantophasma kudubergense]B3A0J8.1 RecName: Full=Extended FMRFamide-3; Short=FMRFa-3 [Pachyphasma brandbergense]